MFKNLENVLSNFSFFTLFFSVIFYWVQASNFCFFTEGGVGGPKSAPPKRKNPTFVLAPGQEGQLLQRAFLGGSEAANDFTEAPWPGGYAPLDKNLLNLGTSGMLFSNFSLGFLLFLRWQESGHFPLSNLYESLLFLSWGLTVLHLFIENFTKGGEAFLYAGSPLSPLTSPLLQLPLGDPLPTRGKQSYPQNPPLWDKKIILGKLIGCITVPSALFINAFATFFLPSEMKETLPLVPALQSNWLMMHVTVMILSYAALILGSLFSIAFLVLVRPKEALPPLGVKWDLLSPVQSTSFLATPLLHIGQTLDHLSYRIIGIGFPFLTLGILSGAVWANEAWGAYWSWDPKETWALLTWLVFAIYLHTRLTKGWKGQKPAFIASFGFIIIWICFLGVNLIGEGLHSYGWFSA